MYGKSHCQHVTFSRDGLLETTYFIRTSGAKDTNNFKSALSFSIQVEMKELLNDYFQT